MTILLQKADQLADQIQFNEKATEGKIKVKMTWHHILCICLRWKQRYVIKACSPLLPKMKPDALTAGCHRHSYLICVLWFPRLVVLHNSSVEKTKERNSDITTHLFYTAVVKWRYCQSNLFDSNTDQSLLNIRLLAFLWAVNWVRWFVLPVSWCQHTRYPPAHRGRDKG